MAIDYSTAALLLSSRKRKLRLGRVLMLGRQHLALTKDMTASLEAQFDIDLQAFSPEEGEEQYAEDFLEWLGAETITSMDFCDYENSGLCHDLNKPIPAIWKGQYDFVIDGGTLEHVFNFPVAIRNAMELVAPNGYFLGSNPANNWLGHGFYQFGPELFFRVFTAANGFVLTDMLLAEDCVGGKIYKVTDPALAGHRIAYHSKHRLASLVLAKKTNIVDELFNKTPQQSDYTARWQKGNESDLIQPPKSISKTLAKKVLPKTLVQAIQHRAIAKRHAEEGSRGLTRLASMNELH